MELPSSLLNLLPPFNFYPPFKLWVKDLVLGHWRTNPKVSNLNTLSPKSEKKTGYL